MFQFYNIVVIRFLQVLSERLSEIQSNELSSESHYYTEISSLQETNENLLRVCDIINYFQSEIDVYTAVKCIRCVIQTVL
jgi:hypothetical protein